MRNGKLVMALVSALALAVILLLAVGAAPGEAVTGPVTVQTPLETLSLWRGDDNTYYAFLTGDPALATLLPGADSVAVEGKSLPCSAAEFPGNTPLPLSWQEEGRHREGTLQLIPAGGIAMAFVDTQSGTMDHIHGEKGNAERGSLRLYDENGTLNYSGSLRSIRGRGNSTWVVPEKKPYTLTLTEPGDLLGMGAAGDWILLADALDTSSLRNKTVLDFAGAAGLAFTPECRWVELYLNGEYAGLYLLCEKIGADPQRVDLPPDGSLISMDRDIRVEEDVTPYFVTDRGQYLQVREGSDLGTLRKLVQDLEDSLTDPEGDDWLQRIDLDSWVKKYLVEEIFGSYDAGFQSQYFYCFETEPDSRIYAGPVWDFDASMGNPAVWSLNSPQGLYACRPQAMAGYDTPWFSSLCEKPEFQQRLREEYARVFLPLLEQTLPGMIRENAEIICQAFGRNRIRWDVQTPGLVEEAGAICTYMAQRTEFLRELWLEETPFCILRLQEGESGGYYGYYAVEPGTCFDALPHHEEGWYREDTGEPFDPAVPVAEDLCLRPGQQPALREEESEDSLMEQLVMLHHYVPAAVLLLMGAAAVLWALARCRGSKTGK